MIISLEPTFIKQFGGFYQVRVDDNPIGIIQRNGRRWEVRNYKVATSDLSLPEFTSCVRLNVFVPPKRVNSSYASLADAKAACWKVLSYLEVTL